MTEKELQRLMKSHRHNSGGGGRGLRVLFIVVGCLALFAGAYLGFNRVVKYFADQSQREEQARLEAQQRRIAEEQERHKPTVVEGLYTSTVTLTNRAGRVFENITILRTNVDSLVYAGTNGLGGGTLKFADLPEHLQKKYGYAPASVAEGEAQSITYRVPRVVQTTADRPPSAAQENTSGVEIMVEDGDRYSPRVLGMTLRLVTGDRIELRLEPDLTGGEANVKTEFAPDRPQNAVFQNWLDTCAIKAYKALKNLDSNPTYSALRKRGFEQQKTMKDMQDKISSPPPQFRRNATVEANYRNTMNSFLHTTSSNYTVTVLQLKRAASGLVIGQSGLYNHVRQ